MKKISIKIDGHSSSFSIEDEFLISLDEISKNKNLSRNEIVSKIEKIKEIKTENLSSKIRIYILSYLKGSDYL